LRPVSARLLLLVDESPGALAAVRGARAGGYEPFVGFSRGDEPARRSRAAAGVVELPDPFGDPDRYVEEAAAAARRYGIAAVLPAMESSLRALTGREHGFGDGVAVGTNPVERLERATDKARLADLAEAAGLQAPRTHELTAADVDARAGELRFPAVVKPIRSVAVQHDGSLQMGQVTRVDDQAALRRLLAAHPDTTWVVQPYVEGELAAICGVVWEGRLVTACHQVSPRIWPPGKGISAFAETVPPDLPRQTGVARMLKEIGWSGIYGVQFILGADGAYAIDLNPRIYGSIGLAIAAGHNLPAIWADLLLGRRPLVRPYRVGVHYRVEQDDIRAIVHLFRSGRRREALAGVLPRPNTAHALFSLHDPAPFLTTFDKVAAKVARR
jgi:predicted ATP-grasp superfamily ATP-dependent carboligase